MHRKCHGAPIIVTNLTNSNIYRNVSQEIGLLSKKLSEVESCMVQLLSRGEQAPASKSLIALQNLDILTQSLDALEVYLRDVSIVPRNSHLVNTTDALKAIRLADLSRRLSCSGMEAKSEQSPRQSGRVDLF